MLVLEIIRHFLTKRSNAERTILKFTMSLLKTAKITEYEDFSASCSTFRGNIKGRRLTISRNSVRVSTKNNNNHTAYIENFPFAYIVVKKKIKLLNEFKRRSSKEREEKLLLDDFLKEANNEQII